MGNWHEILSNLVYGEDLGGVLHWSHIGVVINPVSILERNAFNHVREVFEASNSEPAFLGTFDQLEHQGQDGVLGDTAPGLVGSETDGGKGGFNGVGGANMRPMLSGEIEEGEQDIPVFDQTLGGFRILGLVGGDEPIERLIGLGLVVGSINLPNGAFGLRLLAFGEFVEHIRGLMHPAALFLRGGEHLRQGFPEAQRPIANGQLRGLG